ncbi:hypothetical protein DQM11_04340 [Leuconostoc pseudomesenteroides]|jgi:hypothetical protein|uniref:DUF4352 domain-containing protein n=2 Tax=Leuconostoc TaxID=1243 RepID=A0A9X3E802_9LACO|nr:MULTISPECIES: hypothetical protein [Leuconostoc]MCT4389294.1 hypothetical protein [Leuconostoc falkenbergense]MCT4410691.1 hypothetical protein [Leuconostoc falkenbergense]MCX7578794.1 hypothetical protein [Leuconostoc falkenbergense]MDM7647439.1 hypothetical protein [Leuconostoc falkenbergense]MDV3544799.1 hypothetical protein [Leuconostoc falkenbergense]
METILGAAVLLFLLTFVVFLVLAIVQRKQHLKKWLLFSFGSLILVIIFALIPSDTKTKDNTSEKSSATKSSQAKDKSMVLNKPLQYKGSVNGVDLSITKVVIKKTDKRDTNDYTDAEENINKNELPKEYYRVSLFYTINNTTNREIDTSSTNGGDYLKVIDGNNMTYSSSGTFGAYEFDNYLGKIEPHTSIKSSIEILTSNKNFNLQNLRVVVDHTGVTPGTDSDDFAPGGTITFK